MASSDDYDLVVLGSGEAGKYLAWTLAREGRRVAVIERRWIGGSCPNIACLPTKNVIHSAKVASLLARGAEFGLPGLEGPANMPVVRARKRSMVDGLVEMHLHKLSTSGAELLMGHGRFVGPRRIEIAQNDGGTRTVRGENVVISTGSRARIDDTPGLRQAHPLTHVEALELDSLPRHLLVLGAGYIGLELAQAFRRLGSGVTLVDRNPTVIHREDPDVTAAVTDMLRDEGIEIVAGGSLERVAGRSGEEVRLDLRVNGSAETRVGTHLLVAGGRTPNTDELGLDAAGVEVGAAGHIRVNERLQTTAPGVWAVGDCAGSPHFTHIAFDDFRVVRSNLMGGERTTRDRQVPYCLFTDPELAHVGLSEREAAKLGIAYRLARISMESVLRARTLSETRGFLKALVGKDDDRILGFTAFGAGAGELLAPVQVAMSANLPYTALRDMVLTHPTLSEGLGTLFSSVPD